MSEVVYFVQSDAGAIKIGKTINLKSRLVSLQTPFSAPLVLLGVADNVDNLEGRLHRQFAAFRVKGEWFSPDPSILEWIAKNARKVDKRTNSRATNVDPYVETAKKRVDWMVKEYCISHSCPQLEAQEEVAKAMGVPFNFVWNLHRGRIKTMLVNAYVLIEKHYAVALDVRLEEAKKQMAFIDNAIDEDPLAMSAEDHQKVVAAYGALIDYEMSRKKRAAYQALER